MSRPARKPVPTLALPLFVLGLIVFWLALGTSHHLMPERLAAKQTLPWPESARQGVRRVVLQAPAWHWHETELEWSATQTPQVEIDADRSGLLTWQLVHEGDTLYVRLQEPAAGKAAVGNERTHVTKIVLPPSVDTVHGRRLEVARRSHEHLPPRLSLQAHTLSIYTEAALEQLHLTGLPQEKDCNDSDRSGKPWGKWNRDTSIYLTAPEAAQVFIETPGGSVNLRQLNANTRVQLHTSPDTSLDLDDMQHLPQIDWQPLTPEREAALQQAAKTETSQDCPRNAERQSP